MEDGVESAVSRLLASQPPESSGRLLSALLENVPFGVALIEASELRFIYLNPIYESWLDPQLLPATGRTLAETLRTAPQIIDHFRAVASSGQEAHHPRAEFVGLKNVQATLPGDITLWDWSIYPLRLGQGDVSHLLATGVDVTRAEIERLQLRSAHEAGIGALLEVSRHVGDAASIEAFFGRLTETVAGLTGASRAAFARFDAESLTLVGQHDGFGFESATISGLVSPCRPGDHGLADRVVFGDLVVRASIEGSEAELQSYRGVLKRLKARNTLVVPWRVGETRLGTLSLFDSERTGGFSEDDAHTAQVAAMAAGLVWQHRQAQARLEALEQSKSDFLGLAAHELRGPLAVINGYLSMFEAGSISGLGGQAAAIIPVLSGQARRMGLLVEQMLEMARLEDDRLELKLIDFDIRDAVQEAVSNLRLPEGTAHGLEIGLPATPVRIRGDWDRVGLILANLLDNAVKYSPGGGRVACRVSARKGSGLVEVSDQGIGIPADEVGRLFTRFGRLSGAERFPGTGLGLYLCRRLARRMDGDISVRSTLGEGTTFGLRLPLPI